MNSTAFFNRTKQHFKEKKPFVVFRKSASVDDEKFHLKGIFQQHQQLYTTTDFSESGFVMAPFQSAHNKAVLIPTHQAEIIETSYKKKVLKKDKNFKSIQFLNDFKKEHIQLVSAGIEAIKQKKFEKVVLSEKLQTSFRAHPLKTFRRLLHKYPTAFVYCWYHPKVGLWMGATPERLLKIKDDVLKTVSLAGTKPVIENQKPNWTQKEIDEQQFVTDFIQETLAPNVTDLNVEGLHTIQAGKLWHLKNNISAKLEDKSLLKKVLLGIHPTPAVCGYPKLKAQNFIITNELHDREFYAGFLGELNLNTETIQTDLFVNLRCMKVTKNHCNLYVGGGIVKDSNPLNEWIEIINKSKTMSAVLY